MKNNEDGEWHLAFVVGEIKSGESEATTKINAIEPICHDALKADRLLIFEYHSSLQMVKCVQLNIQEFLQSVVDNAADFLKTENMDEEKFDLVSLNFSRQLLNILSMFRSLLDHSNFSISRKFGKDSNNLRKWKTIQSEQYDSFFEYRLFYNLRNYCQHIGMPPMNISFSNSIEKEGISFRLDFQRDKLLEERSVWKQKLIQDLESAPENIPVIDSLHNWGECFRAISKTLLDIKREEALEAAKRITSHRERLNLPSDVGQLCAVFLPKTKKNLIV